MRGTRSPSTRTAPASRACPGTRSRRGRPSPTSAPPHTRFKQVWFAGSHSDIGGSYPETESRLSDIALAWMVRGGDEPARTRSISIARCSTSIPDHARPAARRAQGLHRGAPALAGACARVCSCRKELRLAPGPSPRSPPDALLHPSVLERLRLPGVLIHGDIVPYRPHALRNHFKDWWQSTAAQGAAPQPSPAHQIVPARLRFSRASCQGLSAGPRARLRSPAPTVSQLTISPLTTHHLTTQSRNSAAMRLMASRMFSTELA